jgi:hypothetical protein
MLLRNLYHRLCLAWLEVELVNIRARKRLCRWALTLLENRGSA